MAYTPDKLGHSFRLSVRCYKLQYIRRNERLPSTVYPQMPTNPFFRFIVFYSPPPPLVPSETICCTVLLRHRVFGSAISEGRSHKRDPFKQRPCGWSVTAISEQREIIKKQKWRGPPHRRVVVVAQVQWKRIVENVTPWWSTEISAVTHVQRKNSLVFERLRRSTC